LALSLEQLQELPSPYYRVATRAIILDDQQRLLVMRNTDGEVELPGGGLEYGESYSECIQREVREELGVEVRKIGGFIGIYEGKGTRNIAYLRIAFRVELHNYDFQLEEMQQAWFVTRDELLQLDLRPTAEHGLLQYIDIIWSK
jgi:8-oxo-dGTP pyrophosphatase MutT (NUDIX family)